MDRALLGSSGREAEDYLTAVFSTCTGFELAVVTSAEGSSRQRLRERLVAAGAEISVVPPRLEQVLGARRVGPEVSGHRAFVLWIEFGSENDADEQSWRELVAALNRSRQRLMERHRYLWVMAGPHSLRRIMTRQGQDLYSGAYKVPHVVAHPGAELRWLHLSDLQLGAGDLGRGPRQGGDVWRSVEELFLPDLARVIDEAGAGPDLVLVSGDLGAAGSPADYAQVQRFLDRVLGELERRSGARPLLLTVPGNHDVQRPRDAVERWRFEVLRRHDAEDDFGRSLREHLWVRQDASLLEPLFVGYTEWARRYVLDALQPDELGMEAGRAYLRSVARSHVPGDWSVVIEKDDFRLGIIGLNTAWTSFDDEVGAGDVFMPSEQIEAALGSSGASAWFDGVQRCLLITHHGPEWWSDASRTALTEWIQPRFELGAHLCGPRQAMTGPGAQQPGGPLVQRGYPALAWGIAPHGRSSGYRLGRIGRDGKVETKIRVLEPIPARGAWRYVDGVEAGRNASEGSRHSDRASWWSRAARWFGYGSGATESTGDPSWWPGALRRYLDVLSSRHGTVSLMGFGSWLRVPLHLDELHVPLDAMIDIGLTAPRSFGSAADAETEHDALSKRGHEVALDDAFESAKTMGRRGIVILGDPGSGKTLQLERLLLKVVQDGASSIGLPEDTVPVFLSLRELHSVEQPLEAFVAQQLEGLGLRAVKTFVKALVLRGRVLYLLDGLDEVDLDARRGASRWVDRQLDLHPEAWFAVTSRYAGYGAEMRLSVRFLELHLRPLDDVRVEEFVRRWYRIVETSLVRPDDRADAERKATERAEALVTELRTPGLRAQARLHGLTHNPLLLTMICLVHRDKGRLPDRRVDLYDECVNVLLETWNQAKQLPVEVPARQARAVLQPVARWMHGEEGRTRASAAQLEPELHKALAAAGLTMDPKAFLASIRDRSGLLTGWSADEYGFMHLGFQEYLAARDIRKREILEPGPFQELARRFGDAWWQEVILLLLSQDDPPMFDRFMREVVARPELVEWSDSPMMDRCLREAAGVSPRPFVEVLREPDGPGVVERQLAAACVLVEKLPRMVGEDVERLLADHPAEAVRAWWEARSQAPKH